MVGLVLTRILKSGLAAIICMQGTISSGMCLPLSDGFIVFEQRKWNEIEAHLLKKRRDKKRQG